MYYISRIQCVMDIKIQILNIIKQSNTVTGVDLLAALGITRQALNKHIKALIADGKIQKIGITRGARYKLAGNGRKTGGGRLLRTFQVNGLAEDKVFTEFDSSLGLRRVLSANAYSIFQYAFTEMLNNAIDHSQSKQCSVLVEYDDYQAGFTIRDYGIGVFHSIFSNFGLNNENEAVGELLKGQSTTMAKKHSGEGIFFTSKIGDLVHFRSHRTLLKFITVASDVFLEQRRNLTGTEVYFRISRQSLRKLDDIFGQYAPEQFDYRFERTKIFVKLFEEEYLSRSSAKRMLYGLEKYRSIVLDFNNVIAIGQGFADEVFRVFRQRYPDIELVPENVNENVKIMLHHVQKTV
ncbi:MAG: DUF4325 domain-containing protein [Candidatus Neomarinimicrobiota bacterium]